MPPKAPDLPAQIGGRYRPIRRIGQGGMGAVYEVEHVHTGEHLALKVMLAQGTPSADAVERFKREARASARIKSDHVVRVTDADVAAELDGALFLVMELLEGADLDRVTRGARAEPADVVEWLRQTARALDKAHAIGIVHRDLKPENLFLTRREDGAPLVKVLDFGIAKMTEERGATKSGQILGTPMFMAPEQAGSGQITPATDLYALGLIGHVLLVGEHYWLGETMAQLLDEILYRPMPAPSARSSTLGPRFDAWFLKACSRDPAARFTSAAEQIEALADALGLGRRALGSSDESIAMVPTERAAGPTPDPSPSKPASSNRALLEASPTVPAAEETLDAPEHVLALASEDTLAAAPAERAGADTLEAGHPPAPSRRRIGPVTLVAIAVAAVVAVLATRGTSGTATPAGSAAPSATAMITSQPVSPSAAPPSIPSATTSAAPPGDTPVQPADAGRPHGATSDLPNVGAPPRPAAARSASPPPRASAEPRPTAAPEVKPAPAPQAPSDPLEDQK